MGIVAFTTTVTTVSNPPYGPYAIGISFCFSALYVTYIPLPLVMLTTSDGSQHIYIAPEAFKVASNEFKDDIEFWQQALPGHLKSQLASVCMLPPSDLNSR